MNHGRIFIKDQRQLPSKNRKTYCAEKSIQQSGEQRGFSNHPDGIPVGPSKRIAHPYGSSLRQAHGNHKSK